MNRKLATNVHESRKREWEPKAQLAAKCNAVANFTKGLLADGDGPANGPCEPTLKNKLPIQPARKGTKPPKPGKKESIPVSKKNIADKSKQKAVKAAMTPEQKAFLDGKEDATVTPAAAAADDLGLGPAPAAKPKKEREAKAADDLGLGKPGRESPLVDKLLKVTEAGKAAREGSVRAQVAKACAGGVKYPTALARLLADESFKAPRSKKFAENREAYAKNRIARMVAIQFITAE